MSKHFRDFETYLSQHYGVKGFPLDWVVRLTLPAITWKSVMSAHTQREGKKSDFFSFQETNYMCRNFMHNVSCNDAAHPVCDNLKVRVEWENGSCSSRGLTCSTEMMPLCYNWPGSLLLTPPGRSTFPPRRAEHRKAVGRHILLASASLLETTQPASSVTLRMI
jgi:hypothetical protein